MQGSDLELLTAAAKAAGAIASRHFRRDPRVWHKSGDAGPVTEADLEIDAMLREELLGARPTYGWLSEETADTAERLRRRRVFVIDPIDGTRAFIEKSPTFSHSLAVVEHGVPVAAVVYLPEEDLLFTAAAGAGAHCNGAPMRPSQRDDLDGARILAAKSNFDPGHWTGGGLPCERHFRSSLAYRLCLVANGAFDGMITLRDCWEWDIAAGTLIAQEAGASATDRHGAALRFNNPHPTQPGLLAGPDPLRRQLLSQLRPLSSKRA